MSNHKYTLSLTKEYVSHWGVSEACRELIQNVIDNPKDYEYTFDEYEPGLFKFTLTSKDTWLHPSTLLLGTSSKKDESSIGHFGEGYKLALLVLTRLGKKVTVINGNLIWKPSFQYYESYGAEVLEIQETDNFEVCGNLSFIVEDLTQDDVALIKSTWLVFQENIGEVFESEYGDIMFDHPGKLYVGGLFVCTTDMKYGYNFKPKHVRLERDRQTVSSWDLKYHSKEMWFETKRWDFIATLISEECPDVSYAEYGCPDEVKEACFRLFEKQYPNRLAAKSHYEMNSLTARGIQSAVYVGSSFGSVIQSSSSYMRRYDSTIDTTQPEQKLKQWLASNRKEMRRKAIVAFKSLINDSKKWRS